MAHGEDQEPPPKSSIAFLERVILSTIEAAADQSVNTAAGLPTLTGKPKTTLSMWSSLSMDRIFESSSYINNCYSKVNTVSRPLRNGNDQLNTGLLGHLSADTVIYLSFSIGVAVSILVSLRKPYCY